MRFIERELQDPTTHLILGEDKAGLFVLFRWGADAVNTVRETLRTSPGIKWFRDFSNQRPDNTDRGAREAVADIFREIQERNLDIPASVAAILNKEVEEG